MSRRVASSSMWFVAWSLEKTVGHGGHGHQIQPIKERKEALCQDVAPFGPATDQRVFCAGAQLSMYRLYMVLYRLCKQWILFLINLNLRAFCPISLTKPKTCPAEHQKTQKTLNSSILSYSGLFRVNSPLWFRNSVSHLEKMLAHSVQGQVGLDARGRRTLDWKTNVCLLTLTIA